MRVVLNGNDTEVEPGATIGALADTVVPDRSRVAVERNRQIVPRSHYDETAVRDGDVIEIVTLVGGG